MFSKAKGPSNANHVLLVLGVVKFQSFKNADFYQSLFVKPTLASQDLASHEIFFHVVKTPVYLAKGALTYLLYHFVAVAKVFVRIA